VGIEYFGGGSQFLLPVKIKEGEKTLEEKDLLLSHWSPRANVPVKKRA